MQEEIKNLATMDCVVIEKGKLLDILTTNKEKHELIFNIAQSGYWEQAQEAIVKKEKELQKSLAEARIEFDSELAKVNRRLKNRERVDGRAIPFTMGYCSRIEITYPENHIEDFNRAIRKVELSVYSNVKLQEAEFEQYVLNNWSWKQSFYNSTYGNIGYGNANPSGYLAITTGYFSKYAQQLICSGAASLY